MASWLKASDISKFKSLASRDGGAGKSSAERPPLMELVSTAIFDSSNLKASCRASSSTVNRESISRPEEFSSSSASKSLPLNTSTDGLPSCSCTMVDASAASMRWRVSSGE